jgi:hypothetical protein
MTQKVKGHRLHTQPGVAICISVYLQFRRSSELRSACSFRFPSSCLRFGFLKHLADDIALQQAITALGDFIDIAFRSTT